MISCNTIEKDVIRNHYDLSTLFYRLFWGPHIHHGLWNADESPQVAQRQLTQRMASLAGIHHGARVVDIGCGMGGSSNMLARDLGCQVTGVTISPFQRRWAQWSSSALRIQPRPDFRLADAEEVEFESGSVDVIWSIECTEHLFDKARFFARSREWLKPGGTVAICAWLCGDNPDEPNTQRLVSEVCEGFFCPSLGTQADYQRWLTDAGLKMKCTEIWTERVLKTWEICRERIQRFGARYLARMLGRDHVLFLDRFDTILEAYRTRAMEYGCFIATLDAPSADRRCVEPP